jgi:hypothetical protein
VFGQAPDYDPPVTNPQQVNASNSYLPVFNLLTGPPFPSNPPIGSNGRYLLPPDLSVYYFFDPPSSYRIPLADSWNLTVQHEFTPTLTAEIGYVGNVGRHLFVNPNVNAAALDPNCEADGTCGNSDLRKRFFPKYGLTQGIYQICNCDNSSYNAMQIKVQKRATHSLDFLLTYTYGKAMANTETGGVFSNNLNWWDDHGPANYDRTHTLTISHMWELPFGRGRHWAAGNGVMDAVLGGWDFTGITTFESGLPYTPIVFNAPNLHGDLNNTRADQIGNPSVPDPSAALWFNPAAFTFPQGVGHNGNVRHNSFRGPGLYNFDLGLGKTFTVAEGKTLEFKWETYNATNHVNLANPATAVDSDGAGQITAAAAMRQMQFGLHFRF